MALVTGIKEKIHLPLYDSLFVRPKMQLRDVESSSVLKFFVNVQGKTKLETNMQSASLLPHWNTFEARALRVVVSDLPAELPEDVASCVEASGNNRDHDSQVKLRECITHLDRSIEAEKKFQDETIDCLHTLKSVVSEFEQLPVKAKIENDVETCMGLFRTLLDQDALEYMLDLQKDLCACRSDMINILQKTRITVSDQEAVTRIIENLQSIPGTSYEPRLRKQLGEVRKCLDEFLKITEWIKRIQKMDYRNFCQKAENAAAGRSGEHSITGSLERVKKCLSTIERELPWGEKAALWKSTRSVDDCLDARLRNKQALPLKEQISGRRAVLLSKLVYNSITTLTVGEKTMIQMPTWFFPSGGGPYSEDGSAVTHGFPSPEATFRFSDPVFVETKQNFRVEIEIPEAAQLSEIQRIYGPFFIWVVLDGYMVRDVQ